MEMLFMEPLKFYEKMGRPQHEEHTKAYFDRLLAESGVDVAANRATVQALNKENETVNSLNKRIGWFKFLRVMLIIAVVLGAVIAIASMERFGYDVQGALILLCSGLAVLGLSLFFWLAKVNPIIKNVSATRDEHCQKAAALLEEAKAQVAPLNALFEDTDTLKLIEKTVPGLVFDRYFTKEKKEFLIKHHDFVELLNSEASAIATLSGTFEGNPFLFCRRLVHEMKTATYRGTLTIHWTEHYRDSQGRSQTRHRSQTLTAHVTKPKPEYHYHTCLGYGCQAAPDLSFDRAPQHWERLSEKERERAIRPGSRKLRKKARRATTEGGTFQEMANTEFDVMFGAVNRDNEVQFRTMFTPLAQCNTVDLLSSKTGYGDDFRFIKDHRYNIIASEHAQSWSMDASASHYYSHDVDDIRLRFMNFNTDYFKSVFFDFAPLFSVPAYVESPCAALEPLEEYDANYTDYSHEIMANAIGSARFAHPNSATEAILKTGLASKDGTADIVSVTAFSYEGIPRVDYVPVLGGDGRYHNVPVHWTEYLPIQQTTTMRVEATDMTDRTFAITADGDLMGSTYFQGMLAKVL